MSQCITPAELCDVFVGDTVSFKFTFTDPDDNPVDIRGMTIRFVADRVQENLNVEGDEDIPFFKKEVIFPEFEDDGTTPNADSLNGVGYMDIYPDETILFEVNKIYYFKFKLIAGVNQIYTVGVGEFTTH
jgi:hypothetical protein